MRINFINKLIECTPGLFLEWSLVISVNMTLLKYIFWHPFLTFLHFYFLGRPADTLERINFINKVIECTPGLSLEWGLMMSTNLTPIKYIFWHPFLPFLHFHFLGGPVNTLSRLTLSINLLNALQAFLLSEV